MKQLLLIHLIICIIALLHAKALRKTIFAKFTNSSDYFIFYIFINFSFLAVIFTPVLNILFICNFWLKKSKSFYEYVYTIYNKIKYYLNNYT